MHVPQKPFKHRARYQVAKRTSSPAFAVFLGAFFGAFFAGLFG